MAVPASTLDEDPAERALRIPRIRIENYKAIESLALEFPAPRTPDEPDVFVLGSSNGVGKSSVLEACAIGLLGPAFMSVMPVVSSANHALVRSGASSAVIELGVRCEGTEHEARVEVSAERIESRATLEAKQALARHRSSDPRLAHVDYWLPRLLGTESDPLVAAPVLLFHSYRKVREGNLAISELVEADRASAAGAGVLSTFKARLIQALMARSGLLEGVDDQTDAMVEQLNALMEEFARGRVDKLRPSADGTLELRVAPSGGGPSYSFDGLSSGQKEIIATLFLVWQATRAHPCVVLIDEPELHLNAEWQRPFVHRLWSLAPGNQYIMATHSEEIFGSVGEERRLLLEPG